MKLVFERRFAGSVERLFDFHADPDNLSRLLAGWPTFRMVAHAGNVEVGSRLVVAERFGGIWWPLTFEFFRFEPPTCFCERQIRGLFLRYQHEHEFVPDGDATLMRDHIDVELPWWLGGALVTRMVVARRLRRFFTYRHRALDALLAQGKGP